MAQFDIPTLNRSITRNMTEPIEFAITQPGTTTPQNITGWTLTFRVKRDINDDSVLVTKTNAVDGGIEVTDAVNGEGVITLEPGDLTLDYETTLIGGLTMEDPSGNRRTRRIKLPYELDV